MSKLIVTEYGRLLFLVQSNSRPWMRHIVDFEPLDGDGNHIQEWQPQCSCEAWEFHVNRPCRHIRAVADYLAPILKHKALWNMQPDLGPETSKQPQKRQYVLKPSKSYETPKPISSPHQGASRRLPKGLCRDDARNQT